MIQIQIIPTRDQGHANEVLREYQRIYPKREIIGVSMQSIDFPGGWFMTITYKIKE